MKVTYRTYGPTYLLTYLYVSMRHRKLSNFTLLRFHSITSSISREDISESNLSHCGLSLQRERTGFEGEGKRYSRLFFLDKRTIVYTTYFTLGL